MEMLRMKLGSVLFAALFIGAVSCDNDDDNDNNDGRDTDVGRNETVINRIAQANSAEIELGQLTATKAADSGVIVYGERMVAAHQKAQMELKNLSEDRNIEVSDSINSTHSALINRLSALSGYNFDTAYINSQLWMHNETRDLFESIKDTTDDSGLENYVSKQLPEIDTHLMKADSIAEILVMGSDTTDFENDTTSLNY